MLPYFYIRKHTGYRSPHYLWFPARAECLGRTLNTQQGALYTVAPRGPKGKKHTLRQATTFTHTALFSSHFLQEAAIPVPSLKSGNYKLVVCRSLLEVGYCLRSWGVLGQEPGPGNLFFLGPEDVGGNYDPEQAQGRQVCLWKRFWERRFGYSVWLLPEPVPTPQEELRYWLHTLGRQHLPRGAPETGLHPGRGTEVAKPPKPGSKGTSHGSAWDAGWLHNGKVHILEKQPPKHVVPAGSPRPTPISVTHWKQSPNRRGGSTCLWEQHALLRRILIKRSEDSGWGHPE